MQEYMHMGDTTILFLNVMLFKVKGENNLLIRDPI
jgi:hypothetical protein